MCGGIAEHWRVLFFAIEESVEAGNVIGLSDISMKPEEPRLA